MKRSPDVQALTKQQAEIARATFRLLSELLLCDHDLQNQILERAGVAQSPYAHRDIMVVRELLLRRMGGAQ